MGKEIEQKYYDFAKPFMDKDGWFPDDILGESWWVLSYCEKKHVGGKIYWRFIKPPSK